MGGSVFATNGPPGTPQYVDVDRHTLRPTVTVVSAGSTAALMAAALLRRTQVPAQHYHLSPLFNQVTFALPPHRFHYLLQ